MNHSATTRRRRRRRRDRRRGTALMFVIGLMAVAAVMASSLTAQSIQKLNQGRRLRNALVLGNLIQSGRARARAELRKSSAYAGADALKLGRGELRIVVEKQNERYLIRIVAAVPQLEEAQRTERFEETWKPEERHAAEARN